MPTFWIWKKWPFPQSWCTTMSTRKWLRCRWVTVLYWSFTSYWRNQPWHQPDPQQRHNLDNGFIYPSLVICTCLFFCGHLPPISFVVQNAPLCQHLHFYCVLVTRFGGSWPNMLDRAKRKPVKRRLGRVFHADVPKHHRWGRSSHITFCHQE